VDYTVASRVIWTSVVILNTTLNVHDAVEECDFKC